MDRTQPNVTVRRNSPNQSRRNGSISLIVLHATEAANGPNDLDNLASWFGNPSSQVSSHVATDGRGNSARFVTDNKKAWHCVSYNTASLGIEQVGHTLDSRWTWEHRSPQLHETARWIARWSKEYGIPIRRARVWRGHVLRKGVCQHSDLGDAGGNHGDCGAGYPFQQVLDLAKQYRKRI